VTDKLDRVRKIIVEKTYQEHKRQIDELEQSVDKIYQSLKKDIEAVRHKLSSDISLVQSALKEELNERDHILRQFLLVKKDLENSKKTTSRILLEASDKNRLFTEQQNKSIASMKATITQEVSKINKKLFLENKSLEQKLIQGYRTEIKSSMEPIDRKLAHIQNASDNAFELRLSKQKKTVEELQTHHSKKIDSLQTEIEALKSMIGDLLLNKK